MKPFSVEVVIDVLCAHIDPITKGKEPSRQGNTYHFGSIMTLGAIEYTKSLSK
ncbi:MAG: hypothetical protein M0R49_11235 [Limnochordia bacterium]|nr:hypothetical protein [Limnochordia bacterium]